MCYATHLPGRSAVRWRERPERARLGVGKAELKRPGTPLPFEVVFYNRQRHQTRPDGSAGMSWSTSTVEASRERARHAVGPDHEIALARAMVNGR